MQHSKKPMNFDGENIAAQFSIAVAKLVPLLSREQDSVQEKERLSQRHALMTQEFEHRILNGLQLVASLLSLQSRTATTAEAAAQLNAAAVRVAAIGRVHRRLHLLDHEDSVDFRKYVEKLCDDISGLLLRDQMERSVIVTGADLHLPAATGIPLAFIVNELVTNAAKYSVGNITVHIKNNDKMHSLTVMDEGPGLPEGFTPEASKGLGMNIVQSLVGQIGGKVHFGRCAHDQGTSVVIAFSAKEMSSAAL